MYKILFDNDTEQSGIWTWHYGNVEIDSMEYPFSICEMYDNTSGTSTFELTWVGLTPRYSNEIEADILSKF